MSHTVIKPTIYNPLLFVKEIQLVSITVSDSDPFQEYPEMNHEPKLGPRPKLTPFAPPKLKHSQVPYNNKTTKKHHRILHKRQLYGASKHNT